MVFRLNREPLKTIEGGLKAMKRLNRVYALGVGLFLFPALASAWQSALVSVGSGGHLTYHPDPSGNLIPDFSNVGYRNGCVAIPNIPVVKTLSPVAGDN